MDYVFPAVFYKDENEGDYYGRFDDVGVFFEGKTIEEAFHNARYYLKEFCKLAIKLYGSVTEKPRTFEESLRNNKGNIVMLVPAEFRSPQKGTSSILEGL